MKREIPGIDALAEALPREWLMYASLNCYPKAQSPMEIDAIVVTEDRVLVLELKDWNGKLTQNGDRWLVNGQNRGRSAVTVVQEKARKLKTVIRSEIPQLKSIWVDGRVILTASSTRDLLAEQEKEYVWTLAEAKRLGDPGARSTLIKKSTLGLLKAYQFEADFDRLTNNSKIFQPLEADWAGYRVVEQNVAIHPHKVWAEHRAERKQETRIKALLRIWAFDQLPPGLNSPDRRRLIANREAKVFGYLSEAKSSLIERNQVLSDVAPSCDEILTQHFEIRNLQSDWTTWDRYIERHRETIDLQDRLTLATTLLSSIAELHQFRVTHRDLGARSVWIGSPTKIAITGFACSQIPEEETVADWLSTLRGYSPNLPEDIDPLKVGTGAQRDVYLVALLIARVLGISPQLLRDSAHQVSLSEEVSAFQSWLDCGLSRNANDRFHDAREMSERFVEISECLISPQIDQRLIDQYETSKIPYVEWPPKSYFAKEASRHVYLGDWKEREVVVKIWNGIFRNQNGAIDLALLRLFSSASHQLAEPVSILPRVMEVGLSPVGPYLVYEYVPGDALATLSSVPAAQGLSISLKLLEGVTALHVRGYEHGDISAKNVLYDRVSDAVYLVDAIDICSVGSGAVRTPSQCPPNWEKLSQHALDRYAAVNVVCDLLLGCSDRALDQTIHALKEELSRPIIETLEPVLSELRRAIDELNKPPIPEFSLHYPNGGEKFFRADGTVYYLTRQTGASGEVNYRLVGVDRQLSVSVLHGVIRDWQFLDSQFGSLEYGYRNGKPLALLVHVAPGNPSGHEKLCEHIMALDLELANTGTPSGERPLVQFDVRRHWDRMLDIEARDRLEVEIRNELNRNRSTTVYSISDAAGVLDFDPEADIDVYLSGRRVGEIDHDYSGSVNTIAIRNATRTLYSGDKVALVDRREQSSIDRRSKAVRRILENQASIPNLIQYFYPDCDIAPYADEREISDIQIERYGLNEGQSKAFRSLLRQGPVGLLQGPPGTGKTRFIASIAHWLMTEGGATRILIASQSHEAVNNVIEALIDLYKKHGGKPNLLRIGSKGITEKIRPYHSSEIRERFRVRFEAAMQYRVGVLAREKGVSKKLTSDVWKIDQELGVLALRCDRLTRLIHESSEDASAADRTRYENEIKRAEAAFRKVAEKLLGVAVDVDQPLQELERAYQIVLSSHPDSSEADVNVVRNLIALAREWSEALSSTHRNFDEFLAKTRGIVTATCVGVGETKIRIDSLQFDWVIVDEAARCTSSELAVPIQLGRRLLLVGDHLQLLPMIKESVAQVLEEEVGEGELEDLFKSDFERAFLSPYGRSVGCRFTEQYRMHPDICALVSACFYEGNDVELTTSLNRTDRLSRIGGMPEVLSHPISWLDTSGMTNVDEVKPANSTTFFNDAEVEVVMSLLERIATTEEFYQQILSGDEESPVGVICMYSGQKERLEREFARRAWKASFRSLVRIDTVDAYQGKENLIVIVSLVRSNSLKRPGHVRSFNRCNVAMSRAKERLFIVGSCDMWSGCDEKHPMKRVHSYVRDRLGRIVPASEV